CWAIFSRKLAAISINFPPFSMNSGMRRQSSSNFSGCSEARVARPIPATASPAGFRPVRNNKAPAAKEPYIKTFFQSMCPLLEILTLKLTVLLEPNRALFVVQAAWNYILFGRGNYLSQKNWHNSSPDTKHQSRCKEISKGKKKWAPVSRGDAHVGVLRMFCY